MIDRDLDPLQGFSLPPSERDDTCILDEYHLLGRALILDARLNTEIPLGTAG